MILKLNTYNYFFASSPYKFYAVEQNGNPDIEAIYYLGEELDLNNPDSYDLAINFLNDCKECDCEICDTCKSPMAETLLGATFVSNLEKIHDTVNETTDKIIELLMIAHNKLVKRLAGIEPCTDDDLPCKACCSCADTEYCEACQNASKASEAVEAVSNTRTFHWAQKYMDTVIDPASELTGPEYNTLLAMFTQYGEWILKQ